MTVYNSTEFTPSAPVAYAHYETGRQVSNSQRNVRKLVNPDVLKIIKEIPFQEALKLGGDLLTHLAQRAVKEVGGAGQWPHISQVPALIQSVLHLVWDPFVALLKHYGGNLGDLFRLGFGNGGVLAGRVLHLSDEAASYTDDMLEAIVRIGDDLGEAGIELSDEAAEGLGELAKRQPEGPLRKILSGPCPVGLTQAGPIRIRGLASPLPVPLQFCQEVGEEFLTNYLRWDVQTRQAFDVLVEAKGREVLDILYTNRELF